MTVPQANAISIPVGRPVSLTEAFLFSVTVHLTILAILFFLGLLSVLFEQPVQQKTDDDKSVRFTFAPEVEQAEEGAVEGRSDLIPPTPPVESPPDPDARATLDEPRPRILPVPGERVAAIEPDTDADADEPPSDGLDEGVAGGETREQGIDADEPIDERELQTAADGDSPADENIETELDLPETDDGGYAMLEQPSVPEPPAPGRPFGPSLDERISDFGRAVQKIRAAPSPQPMREPAKVFEPDWPSLPPTGQTLGNLTFESGDFDWEDYGRQIYWIIWRTWHNRLFSRVDDFEKWAQQNNIGMLNHINAVQFTIESNGEISSIVLETDSGMVPFDLSSTEALEEAVLPPLPDDFPRDRETVHAQFIGYGQIGSMRRSLQEFKRRGWF